MSNSQEFDRQIQNLLQISYPKLANLDNSEFLKLIEPLKEKLKDLETAKIDLEKGILPFVIVVKSELVDSEIAMSLVDYHGKSGYTKLYPHTPKDFLPIESLSMPVSPVYLLTDIDRGSNTLNIRPQDALKIIQENNRTPLTIDEGIAIMTHFPEFLIKNNCFSLLGSRHQKDQRVPAIWINSKKQPNLGWCWDGNPHTWLGSASAKYRLGY